jgi:hypothetical protein
MAKDLSSAPRTPASIFKRWFFTGVSKVLHWQAFTGGAGHTFRTEAFRAAGGYSSLKWPYVLGDHELVHRIHKVGSTVYHPDHWCITSTRRRDRRSVSWTKAEQTLYFLTPQSGHDWLWNRFLAGRFAARHQDQLKLREQTWQAARAADERRAPANVRAAA